MRTSSFHLRLIFLWLCTVSVIHAGIGDRDNDGLRDEVETGTRIFVSPENTGTLPDLADSDGDSLPDGLELNLGTNPTDPNSKKIRPNIILINCDDLGYGDVGCFWQNQKSGSQKFATPGFDAMAAQGIMMTHHYAAAPVCASSRASLLQGRHQGHADVRDSQFDKPLPNNHSISSVLQRAGYKTIHIGKAGLAGTGSINLPAHPLSRGFDRFFGYYSHYDAQEHYPQNGVNSRSAAIRDDYRRVTDAYVDLYTTDVWTGFAKKTIIEETQNNPTRPFFIYLAYDAPHFDNQVPPTPGYPSGKGLSGGIQWLGSPAYVNTATNDPTKINNLANQHPSVNSAWPQSAREHVSMIRRIDDSVADLLQTLRDLKIDGNTLVVLTSDNGPDDFRIDATFFQGYANFEGKKFDMWEGGLREPTIAWWPGRILGTNNLSNIRRTSRPSAHYDWLATFAELGGISAPSYTDGVSLAPSLTGIGKQDDRGYLYFEFYNNDLTRAYFPNHKLAPQQQMQNIRIGDFMGVRRKIASATDNFQIYKVSTDDKQIFDLSATMPELQAKMKDLAISARRPGGGVSRPYDSALLQAVSPAPIINGLKFQSYEGYWSWIPEFRDLAPTASGLTIRLTPTVRSRNKDVGLSFTGYISVPTDGAYTFTTRSDAATSLWIHDGHVIDNDFNFSTTASSTPVYLEAGLHPLRLYYRHQGSAPYLDLSYTGPNISFQSVPASAYFVEGSSQQIVQVVDRDGDGSSDTEEDLTGTNPNDASSYFKIESFTKSKTDTVLRWLGVSGRTYLIESSNDLNTWIPVSSVAPITVTSPTLNASASVPDNGMTKRFLRVTVTLSP